MAREGSLLIQLPTAVGRNVVATWLTATAWSFLDSAYCNQTERKLFLEVLNRCETPEQDSDFSCENLSSRLAWTNRRNIGCTTFVYHCNEPFAPDAPVLEEFFKRIAGNLRYVRIDSDDTMITVLLELVAENHCALRVLSVRNAQGDQPPWEWTIGEILSNSSETLAELAVNALVEWYLYFAGGSHFPALRTVRVHIDGDIELISICKAAPNLVDIHVGEDPFITEDGLAAIGEHCHSIRKFGASNTENVADVDAAITALVGGCPQLTHLDLAICQDLTDVGLIAVATHCTQLQVLIIADNDNITDDALTELAACGSLTSLYLHGCPAVTVDGIVQISTRCPLHTLELWEMDGLDVDELVLHLNNVQTLSLCSAILTDDTLAEMTLHMTSLQKLRISVDMYDAAYTEEGLQEFILLCSSLQCLELAGDNEATQEDVERWEGLKPGFKVILS